MRKLLISAGTALAALVAAPSAFALNVDQVGGTTTNYSSSEICRGAKVRADHDATILSYDFQMKSSVGKELSWYVYEASSISGSYDRIAERVTTGTVSGSGFAPEVGPAMYAQMTEGNFYALIVCWDAATSLTWKGQSTTITEPLPFGEYVAGAWVYPDSLDGDGDSINSTSLHTWMKLHSSAGDADESTGANESLYSSPLWMGNLYEVTEDRVLLGFDQLWEVTAGATTVNWAVMVCANTTLSGCDGNDSNAWTSLDSGVISVTDDTENLNEWVRVTDIQVQLEAGKIYWWGQAGPNAGLRTAYTSSAFSAEPSWADNNRMYYAWGETITSPATLTGPVTTWAAIQKMVTIDDDQDEQDGSTTCCGASGTNRVDGNVFEVTSNTRIQQFAFEIDPVADEVLQFGIYESTGTINGPWSLVWEQGVEVYAASSMHWVESGPVEVDLYTEDDGSPKYWMLAVGIEGNGHNLGYQAPYADQATSFGTWRQLTYHSESAAGIPATLPTGSAWQNLWSYRIESCDSCADVDGDGVTAATDCDDMEAAAYPGNPEVCDAIDNDCDGTTDEGFDSDGDGVTTCAGDCDDDDGDNYPGNAEDCDGQDNDCGGDVDEDFDIDGDGWFDGDDAGCVAEYGVGSVDCNDSNGTINPAESESCDGVDEDCDGSIDEDFDTDDDGYFDEDDIGCETTYADLDCDDGNGDVNPGESETCNSVDDNCSGAVDEGFDADGDGFFDEDECDYGTDCDDSSGTVYPAAPEGCNGIDNNCDGVIQSNELDTDGDGFRPCSGDCNDGITSVNPGQPEACDGYDTDCSGSLGNGSGGEANELDTDNDDYFACEPYPTSGFTANPAFGGGDCDDNEPDANPGEGEVCDGFDNDCDGTVDEDLDGDGDGETTCAGDCDDDDANVYTGAPEICDGKDSNCDGVLPGTEQDSDGDQYIDCTLAAAANPPAPIEGGGDCDDTVAVVNPREPQGGRARRRRRRLPDLQPVRRQRRPGHRRRRRLRRLRARRVPDQRRGLRRHQQRLRLQHRRRLRRRQRQLLRRRRRRLRVDLRRRQRRLQRRQRLGQPGRQRGLQHRRRRLRRERRRGLRRRPRRLLRRRALRVRHRLRRHRRRRQPRRPGGLQRRRRRLQRPGRRRLRRRQRRLPVPRHLRELRR